MTPEQLKHQYQNDVTFKRTVDLMVNMLRARQLTQSMLVDAAGLAMDIVQREPVRCPFNVDDVVQLFDPTHPMHEQLGLVDRVVNTGMIDQVDLRFTDDSVSRVSVLNVIRPWI